MKTKGEAVIFVAVMLLFLFFLAMLPSGQSLNCDSQLFMWLAASPSKLLEKNNVRQDRPGFVLAASLLSHVMSMCYNQKERVIFVGYNVSIIYILLYILYCYQYSNTNAVIFFLQKKFYMAK